MFTSDIPLTTIYTRLSELLATAGFSSTPTNADVTEDGFLRNTDTALSIYVAAGYAEAPDSNIGEIAPGDSLLFLGEEFNSNECWVRAASGTPVMEFVTGSQGYITTGTSGGGGGIGGTTGDVTNTIILADGTGESTVQASGITITGDTDIAGITTATFSGSTSGTTILKSNAVAGGTITLPAVTTTLIGASTTDTFTNKTYDTAGTGNSFSINGVAVTANTGTGSVVRATSPTLVTPVLGTPTSGTLTNCTLPVGGITGLGGGVATFLATPSSANLATAMTDETGGGALVFATSPTLVTPALGTPSSGVLTNCTGTASGLTAGTVTTNANLTGDVTSVGNATTLTNAPVIAKVLTGYTSGAGTVSATDSILQAIQKLNGNDSTNANLTGPITSVGNATSVASQTGTGSTFVMNTSPTLVTPLLGTPTSGTLTNCTFPTLNQDTTGYASALKSATTTVSVSAATAPTSGQVLTATGASAATWQTPASGVPTQITVANEATDTTCFPLFVTAATGDLGPKTNANLTFNSNTGVVTLVAPVLGTPTSGTLTNCTFPTLNQNTTGSAAKWTTARNLAGNSVDGSATVAFANTFIVQGTADSGLSAAQFLGALATGIVKNTTTTGVLSIATGADLPTMTATVGGAVPTPPNNTTTFLRGDGTFNTPAGGGNVSNTGTPTSGQAAEWTSATVLQGVAVTGTVNYVKSTSPTLVTPILGVASATSLATSAASPLLLTNGQLVSVALTSQTVGATTLTIPDFASVVDEFTFKTKAQTMSNKTFVAPALGTPASGTLTNCTLPVGGLTGLGTGVATFLATPSSANLASAVTDETGSGLLVFATSPTLTTPTIGVATATSINKMTITAPATSSTLAVADGKTLTASNTLTLAGTDSTTMTFPASSATVAGLGISQTFTGIQTLSPTARSSGSSSYLTVNIPADTGQATATESIGYQHVTASRAWVDGTVTLQRENFFAGPTYNKTTTSATFTDAFTMYITPPIAGTGVTFTRGHTLGIVDSTSAASSITGGLVVSATIGTTATSVGIGGGNVNAGGNGTFGGTLSVTGHVTLEGVTSTGATGTGLLVFGTSPTFVTPVLGTPSSGTLTNCTFPTLNQNTSGSAASLSISGQSGLMTVTGLASTNRIKTVRDAADTILELGGSYTPTGTWTSLTMVTPVLGTPTSGTLTNCTGLPVAGITASTSTALGVGSIELGAASDTTLARVAAGVLSVEGQTLNGYTTTATAAATTTLTVAATRFQLFTGSTTQTVKLPTTSVVVGQDYVITSTSTGLVSVQSSGANAICTLGLNQSATFTAIAATPTTAANWVYVKTNVSANTNGKRLLTVTQSATPAMDTDNGDIMQMTGLAQAITSMSSSLTGTPVAGDIFELQITDNGTARALTFGASFGASTIALPTTTVISTMLRILFQYDTVWRCIATC